jgi:TorA maturation chaperone TorD
VSDRADLIRGLGVLCERPGPSTAHVADSLGLSAPAAVEHTDLFVHQLPPYASIYLDSQGRIGGEARDRIAGFWRAMGLAPPAEPDHLASLLGLWAGIMDAATGESKPGRRRLLDHSSQALIREHLASWLTPYLARVVDLSGDAYRPWAELVRSVTREVLAEDDVIELPVHLRMPQTALAGPEDLIPYLLAPVRSGIVFTRADLHRAATTLGLGMRIGERAFVLRSLLEQARDPVIEWVSVEASRQARARASWTISPDIEREWSLRADTTASLVRGMAVRGTPV